jgi:hypothetical protein
LDPTQQALQDRKRRAAAAAQAAFSDHSRLLALQQQQTVRAQAATTAVPASAPELPRPQPQRLFPMHHAEHMVVQEVQDAGQGFS